MNIKKNIIFALEGRKKNGVAITKYQLIPKKHPTLHFFV